MDLAWSVTGLRRREAPHPKRLALTRYGASTLPVLGEVRLSF